MKEAVAYFIGGPLDLSKQVLREAVPVFRAVKLSPMIPTHLLDYISPCDTVLSNVVLYRRRVQLRNDDDSGREVYIYEVYDQ